jgi:hypothetical protein
VLNQAGIQSTTLHLKLLENTFKEDQFLLISTTDIFISEIKLGPHCRFEADPGGHSSEAFYGNFERISSFERSL